MSNEKHSCSLWSVDEKCKRNRIKARGLALGLKLVYTKKKTPSWRIAITTFLHKNDLPEDLHLEGDLAIDTETLGLNNWRDRLCVLQLSNGNGDAHLVQFEQGHYDAPRLCKLLANPTTQKLFHYARFDLAVISLYLKTPITSSIFCTKIASKIARTYTDSHGLKELCRELLGLSISKQQQSSYWGADTLTKEQLDYAATDVLHLHQIRDVLTTILKREDRFDHVQQCFNFLPTRVALDLQGFGELDIFIH